MNRLLAISMGIAWSILATAVSAQLSPPLVQEQGRYAYTFGVPKGWTYTFEEARNRGLRILYHPEGCLLRDATSVIHIGEVCQSGCAGKLDTAINDVAENARELSPAMSIASAAPLKLNGGVEAQVRILFHRALPGEPRDTLAFIPHDDTIVLVVMTTKGTDTWESDYRAFKEVVQGHRFYDCRQPGVTEECQ